jgi:hypothetical protein
MATTKATLVARRIEHVEAARGEHTEAALEELERDLESGESASRERILRWYAGIAAALRKGLQARTLSASAERSPVAGASGSHGDA